MNIAKLILKIIFKIIKFIVLLIYALMLAAFKKPGSLYGSARYLKNKEKDKILSPNNEGVTIDGINRLQKELSYNHLIAIAPSGAGKTTTIIIPSVISIQDSIIVFDPSGEIYDKTYKIKEKQGFEIKFFSLADIHNSLKFNPLHRCNSSSSINELSNLLVETKYGGNTQDQFWNDGGKIIISLFIQALKNQNIYPCNLKSIKLWLNKYNSSITEVDNLMKNSLSNEAFQEYCSFVNQDPKVANSFLSTAKNSLINVDNNIEYVSESETLFFEDLRKKKTILYINIPEHKIAYYSFITSILYSQIFDCLLAIPKPDDLSVFFLMEEFANSCKISDFAQIVSVIRKRRVSLTLIVQSIEQLMSNYKDSEAKTILDNMAFKIFFPGISPETCYWIEKAIGPTTIFKENFYKKAHKYYHLAEPTEIGRPLIRADEIRTLPKNKILLLTSNSHPVILNAVPYYQNHEIMRLIN